jgi:glycosyltransferase involved in cell wall biosynthesis
LREKIKKEIRKIDDQEAIDGAISFWYGECAWAGKWASKQLQIPHYCWIWGQDARKPNPYPPRLRLKGEELIALSDSLQHEFEKNHGIAPSHVIPPGIGKAHSWNETNRDIDLLAVGSLIPLKQYEIFVELVAELRNQFPTIKAVIIGEGPERKRLKEMIGRYQLENELQLKGELPNDEVIHFMRRSKLLLHPSSYEGFSIACLEALYANMEICSFVKPMNRSIENWYIVKDKKEMKLKTMELLQNRRNIQAGDPFPINVSIDRLMALFGF